MIEITLVPLHGKEQEKMTATAVYGRAESRNLSIRSHLSLNVVFHQWSSSVKGRLPSKVIFRQWMSSVKGCLPS